LTEQEWNGKENNKLNRLSFFVGRFYVSLEWNGFMPYFSYTYTNFSQSPSFHLSPTNCSLSARLGLKQGERE
jgi:hypothetical protein